jgi:hypothetical protein
MPIYEYEGDGRSILLRRPVAGRNRPVVINGQRWVRRTVPTRINVGTGAKPETQSQRTWRGYRDLEMAGKLDDRPGYLPAATIKRALLEPETD